MGAYNVVGASSLVAGQPEDVSQVLANFNLIATILNGGIDNSNINAAAAIAYSKLALAGGIVNADINAAAAIVLSKLAGYPADATKFARGDGTWAAPVGSMALICSSVAGGAVASFDTNTILGGNIPNTYNHLRAVIRGRGDTAATNTPIVMRMNNDSGANYHDERFENTTATALAAAENLAATLTIVGHVAAASATAGHPGMAIVDIPMYNDTVFQKMHTYASILSIGTATANKTMDVGGGSWHNTAAITRLTFLPSVGNFIAGTGFYLYGII